MSRTISPTYRLPYAKYPAVRIALLLSAGIAIDYQLHPGLYFWIIFSGSAGISFFLFEFLSTNLKTAFYFSSVSCYLLFILFFGGFWHSYYTGPLQIQSESGPPLSAYIWQQVGFKGEVYQIRQSSTGNIQLNIEVDSTFFSFSGSIYAKKPYKIRAVLDAEKATAADAIQLGDHLTFLATVYPLQGKRNPYAFNYKKYLAKQRIHHTAGIDTLYSVQPSDKRLTWIGIRRTVLNIIDGNFSEATAPLAKALMIGYKNELTGDDKAAFSRAGLSHIMAVSGLHVGFVLAPFWFLTPYFWSLRYGRPLGFLILILVLFSYAGLTGFTASVTRASITGGFIMYGRLFNKVRNARNLTALAAVIILLINPRELFEPGFQLSFAAVYIILLVVPVICSGLPAWVRYRWYGKLFMVILVSALVQIGLYPLLSCYFGEFSLIGPLANAIVVPALAFMIPYALCLLPISVLFSSAGYYLYTPVRYFLEFLRPFVEYAATLPGSWIQTNSVGSSLFLFLFWTAAILGLATIRIPSLRWKMLSLFLSLLCIQQSVEVYKKMRRPELEITIFDVGQGDAALVKTPGNQHFLIDTGRWSPDYSSARYVLLPHLQAMGIEKLDAVFLSHPHADHIGGITELIGHMPIHTIYNSGYIYESGLYTGYLQKASEKGVPIVPLNAGTSIDIDPTIKILVYGPEAPGSGDNPNEHSLVIELVYGSTEFLFTGDAGYEQEMRLADNYGELLSADFLKVGHHGSRTSSSNRFLNAVSPDISVVSLSRSNRYQHPHSEAVQRLRGTGTRLYFTSLDKALIFASDGKQIRRERWW